MEVVVHAMIICRTVFELQGLVNKCAPKKATVSKPIAGNMKYLVYIRYNLVRVSGTTWYQVHRVFAKNRYTWSLWCQNQAHSKTKYKSHARSPPIGQPHIVPVFDLKKPGTPGFVYFV